MHEPFFFFFLLQSLIDTGKACGIIVVATLEGRCLKEETGQCPALEDEKD